MAAEQPAPTRLHGTLVEVAQVGLLLLGRSGIGKSEAALELVMRGHKLVADDVVLIEAGQDGRPVGRGPELVRHYVELRGIGIVHVPSLFGDEAVAESAPIELVVHLEAWDAVDVERLGLVQRTHTLAGISVAELCLPVAPGRNVASLVEVAVRNHKLQQQGRSSVHELDDRVTQALRGRRS